MKNHPKGGFFLQYTSLIATLWKDHFFMAQKIVKLRFEKLKPVKPAKLVWTKAPPPFDPKKLKAIVRAYVARQKRIKAELENGETLGKFGSKAA